MNPQSIGEAAIPQSVQAQVSPDVTSQQGQSQLFQKAVQANKVKPAFDAMLKKVASKVGGESSSRVKQIETMAAKVSQKRLQGRDYGLDDINDSLGGRIVVKNKSQMNAAKSAIKDLEKQGLFQINEAEPVKQNDYSAFHFDITLPSGLDAEVQIHDQRSAAKAVANHDLRAIHGEKPENDAVKRLRDVQAKTLDKMPGEKALAISKTIQSLRQQNGGKPIDPRMTAQLISKGGEAQ